MDLSILEAEFQQSQGAVARRSFLDTAPASPDNLVSVWRGTTDASDFAHGSLRGLVESPLLQSTAAPVVAGPKIGLSILAPEEDLVMSTGTVVSSPVLESKMRSFNTSDIPEFTQWEPKL